MVWIYLNVAPESVNETNYLNTVVQNHSLSIQKLRFLKTVTITVWFPRFVIYCMRRKTKRKGPCNIEKIQCVAVACIKRGQDEYSKDMKKENDTAKLQLDMIREFCCLEEEYEQDVQYTYLRTISLQQS